VLTSIAGVCQQGIFASIFKKTASGDSTPDRVADAVFNDFVGNCTPCLLHRLPNDAGESSDRD